MTHSISEFVSQFTIKAVYIVHLIIFKVILNLYRPNKILRYIMNNAVYASIYIIYTEENHLYGQGRKRDLSEERLGGNYPRYMQGRRKGRRSNIPPPLAYHRPGGGFTPEA